MKLKIITPSDAVKSDKQTIEKSNISSLQKGINTLIEKLDKNTTAKKEHAERIEIMSFLKTIDYTDNDFAYEDEGIDLAIKANSKFGVLFETKSSLETKDMISHDNLNVKPMQQVIYYYLQQRTSGNNEIKHIIVTNGYDWYIFDALDFDRLFYRDNKLKKDFKEHQSGAKAGKSTKNFYEEIAQPFIENSGTELKAVYFNLKEYITGKQTELKALYKLLSGKKLLKKKKKIDSNKLNTKFFKELLYIMGLEEQKEGSKKLIRQKAKPDEGSLLENLKAKIEAHGVLDDFKDIEKYGSTYEEQLFGISLELVLTWINRLLFLKLLEGQLADYHKDNSDKYKFLNYKKVNEFDILDVLFFEVLNVPVDKRKEKISERYPNIPYLNSSLFEPSALEKKVAFISAMKDNLILPLHSQTVLTNEPVKELPTLDYLLKFLEAYNFASHAEDDIYTEKGELINASVLGLVFEKINGYKEGSFYTPGFITEYMARETIQKAVIQKFNDAYKLDIDDFDELRNYTIDKAYKKDKIIEFNKLINSLKIIDPAVGSGHFLVSSLNEILSIKSELGILADEEGNRLACKVEIENDTAVINDNENKLFRYSLDEKNQIIEDKNKIQSGIFHEKKTIIENCLFGVDINPNSVKICRLRLWIELLKNSYYNPEDIQLETLPNIDINIKEGNSLISRFPLDADIKKALKISKWDIASYQNAVKTYHEASDKNQKREMLRLIDTIKNDFETEITTNDKRYLKLNKQKGELFQIQNQGGLFEMGKTEKAKWNKEIEKLTGGINKLEAELEDIKNNVIYRNALEWRFEFPEVLDDDGNFIGFDVVIGNPPYISNWELSENNRDIVLYLQEEYKEYLKGHWDIFGCFIPKAYEVLKANGFNSYILPTSFYKEKHSTETRKFFLNKTKIIELIDFGEKVVFDDVARQTGIYLIQKQEIKSNSIIVKEDVGDESWLIQQSFFSQLKNFTFKLQVTDSDVIIYNKLVAKGEFLGHFACINTGVVAHSKASSKIKFKKDDVIHKKFEDGFKKYIIGANIKQYSIQYDGHYMDYTSKKDFYHRPKYPLLFDLDKIVIRRISGKNNKLISCFDNEKYYSNDNLMHLQLWSDAILEFQKPEKKWEIKDNSNISLKYIQAIINSKLITYYFSKFLSTNTLQGTYSSIYPEDIRQIPLIDINQKKQSKLIVLVDKILKLKKANPQADTTTLETEIDKMVYELYELTEEEIGIVETVRNT